MSLQIQKNDKRAYWLIGIFSVIVFAAVVFLSRFTIDIDLGFDKHVFAKINAILNSMVSILLVWHSWRSNKRILQSTEAICLALWFYLHCF